MARPKRKLAVITALGTYKGMFSKWGDVDEAFQYWAELTRKKLLKLSGHEQTSDD